jgi:hypothetical protein
MAFMANPEHLAKLSNGVDAWNRWRSRTSSLTSAVTCGLPTGFDFQRQKRRNAARCQPIKVEYSATVFKEQERRTQDRKRRRLHVQAKELGFHLVPIECVP